MSLLAQLDQKIAANDGLIVSYRPVLDSPLDKPEIVATMALMAKQTDTAIIRIESVANLQATYAMVSVPIVGIVKRDLEDSLVRITAYIEDIDALVQASADIIAIDGTNRPRPVPIEMLLACIHHHDLLVVTGYSTLEDGLACQGLGTKIIDTTPSGYITPETPEELDLALMKTLSSTECRMVTEGRYNAPAQVTDVVRHDAWTVTVDSTITRLKHVCQWYNTTMKEAVL